MSELEQLREEIAELRERIATLEARKARIERADYEQYRQQRDEWLKALPHTGPQPVCRRTFSF